MRSSPLMFRSLTRSSALQLFATPVLGLALFTSVALSAATTSHTVTGTAPVTVTADQAKAVVDAAAPSSTDEDVVDAAAETTAAPSSTDLGVVTMPKVSLVSFGRPYFPPGYNAWSRSRDYGTCVASGAFYFMVVRYLRGAQIPPWIGQGARDACLRFIYS